MEWICKNGQWQGLQILIEITAQITDKRTGEQQSEVRYYMSNMDADAACFNRYVRSHWGIENSLHWNLDVVFSEDSSCKRAGNAAENFALISRISLNILKNDKSVKVSMKNKRHKAGWNNEYLIHLLTSAKILDAFALIPIKKLTLNANNKQVLPKARRRKFYLSSVNVFSCNKK